MPSRSNPNTPTALKRKSAAQLKSKRKQTQRKVIHSKITKSVANSSKLGCTANTTGTRAVGTIKGVGRVKGTSQEIRKEIARRRRIEQAAKREKAAMEKGKRVKDGEEMDVEEEWRGEEVGMDVD